MGSVEDRSDSALWHPRRRAFTAGLLLVITLVAFEAMGLGTALPTIVAAGSAWWARGVRTGVGVAELRRAVVGVRRGGSWPGWAWDSRGDDGGRGPVAVAGGRTRAQLLGAADLRMLGQALLVGAGGVVVSALATAVSPARGVPALDLVSLVAAVTLLRAGRVKPA